MSGDLEDRVREVLSHIDPNCERKVWWQICAGVKNELGDAGFAAFDEWSAGGESYNATDTRSTWRSTNEMGGKTFASVVDIAKLEGYVPKRGAYKKPTQEELDARAVKYAERMAVHAAEEAKEAAEAAARATKRWNEAMGRPATAEHPYLKKKGVQPHGLRLSVWWKLIRVDGEEQRMKIDNVLYIPMFDKSKKVHSLQGITVEGEKLFLSGGVKKGHFYPLGTPKTDPDTGKPVFVFAEGFATGAAIHESTGDMVFCCFDLGNMVEVVKQERAERPDAIFFIAADNDTLTKGNPGMTQGTDAAIAYGARLAAPPPGDFNDLFLIEGGAKKVQEAFAQAKVPIEPFVAPAGPADALLMAVTAPLGGELNSVKRPVHDVHQMDRVNEMSWPHMDLKPGGTKPLNTIPNLKHLLNNYHFTVRYDVIRKELIANHPGQRGTPDNVRSKVIDTVLSLAALNHLPRSDVPSFLLSIGDDHQVNPVIDFITAKEWDGISRFDELLASIKTKPGFDRELLTLLVRRWLTSAVAAAATSKGFWSKGVLVFQGEQSLGKTAWFRALLPMAMRDLVKVDAHIDPANKDTIISAVSHWLVELGELDGTLRKTDIARLKGFISQDLDQFRRPYGRAEEKFQRRTVFFASVNPEQFLADETGNVRWWTVPVSSINASHNIDMQQLWAEVFTWFKAGERWWLDSNEEARLNSANAAHEQGSPVDELITCRYDFAGVTRRALTATQVLLELGYDNPNKKTLNESASVMRKHFGDSTKSNSRRVFRVPCLIARP